jgi:methylphosphotriester-DNA--protein-cysteine methyltransferase
MFDQDRVGMIAFSPERMAYFEPGAHENDRILGAFTVYVSLDQPFGIRLNGRWREECHLARVEPYARHSVRGTAQTIAVMLEAETLPTTFVEDSWRRLHEQGARWWAERIVDGFERWRTAPESCTRASFDMLFFGRELDRRPYDWRVATAIERIRTAPDAPESTTTAIADDVGLSSSRLRHAFREQVGVPIRSFRSWKRLRKAIELSVSEPNLLNLAMAAGYADSTHFSHSVQAYLGDRARDLCLRWRNLAAFSCTTAAEGVPLWMRLN